MYFLHIDLHKLIVNPENDRHGVQSSEQEAVNWLFVNHGSYMLNLLDDIADAQEIYDPPLVMPMDENFIVFDGNRRVSALKILAGLIEVPQVSKQLLNKLTSRFNPTSDFKVGCQVEVRRNVVDLTLSRRHNGTDSGRGQLRWDTRAKSNYIDRVGGTKNYEIAVAVENFLLENGYDNSKNLKRSTIFRLLNTKSRQERFGVKLGPSGRLELTKPFEEVLPALTKIADDVISSEVTLKDVLNSSGIENYLQKISSFLPIDGRFAPIVDKAEPAKSIVRLQRSEQKRDTLISKKISYGDFWSKPSHGKIEKIWSQLQFSLKLDIHEISVPIVLRALIETVTYQALSNHHEKRASTLSGSIKILSEKMKERSLLDEKARADVDRFASDDNSHRCLEALQRAVHSPSLTISRVDLLAIWDMIEPFLIAAIKAPPPSNK